MMTTPPAMSHRGACRTAAARQPFQALRAEPPKAPVWNRRRGRGVRLRIMFSKWNVSESAVVITITCGHRRARRRLLTPTAIS